MMRSNTDLIQIVRSLLLEVIRIQGDITLIYLLCMAFVQEEVKLDVFLKSLPTYFYQSLFSGHLRSYLHILSISTADDLKSRGEGEENTPGVLTQK